MAIPPHCKFCGKDIRDENYFWINFKKTDKTDVIELKNDKQSEKWCGPHFTDRGAYFCEKHKVIEKYSHLTMLEAIEKLKNEDNSFIK